MLIARCHLQTALGDDVGRQDDCRGPVVWHSPGNQEPGTPQSGAPAGGQRHSRAALATRRSQAQVCQPRLLRCTLSTQSRIPRRRRDQAKRARNQHASSAMHHLSVGRLVQPLGRRAGDRAAEHVRMECRCGGHGWVRTRSMRFLSSVCQGTGTPCLYTTVHTISSRDNRPVRLRGVSFRESSCICFRAGLDRPSPQPRFVRSLAPKRVTWTFVFWHASAPAPLCDHVN